MSLVWIVISFFGGGNCVEVDDWNGWLTFRCLLIFAKVFWRWQDKGKLPIETGPLDSRLSVIQELTEQQRRKGLVPHKLKLATYVQSPQKLWNHKKNPGLVADFPFQTFLLSMFVVPSRVFTVHSFGGCISSWWPPDSRRKCLTFLGFTSTESTHQSPHL